MTKVQKIEKDPEKDLASKYRNVPMTA